MCGKHDTKKQNLIPVKYSDQAFYRFFADPEIIKRWCKYISANLMAVISLCVSLIGLFLARENHAMGFKVLFAIIMIHSLCMLIYGIYIAANHLNDKNIRLQFDHDMESAELKHQQELKNLEFEKERILAQKELFLTSYHELNKNHIHMLDDLQLYLQRLDQFSEDFMRSLQEEQEQASASQKTRPRFYASGSPQDTISKNVTLHFEQFLSRISDDYQHILRNVLDRTRTSIEKYLSSQGLEQTLALTMEQFMDPISGFSVDPTFQAKPYVYTAFQDCDICRTSYSGEKQPRLYTIIKNTRFLQALSHGSYIFNHENDKNFLVEQDGYPKTWDCGATCLVAHKAVNDKILYGFLSCSSKQDSKATAGKNSYAGIDKEAILMDQQIAMILEFSSKVISSYFHAIDLHWNSIRACVDFDGEESPLQKETFWNWLYLKHFASRLIENKTN